MLVDGGIYVVVLKGCVDRKLTKMKKMCASPYSFLNLMVDFYEVQVFEAMCFVFPLKTAKSFAMKVIAQ